MLTTDRQELEAIFDNTRGALHGEAERGRKTVPLVWAEGVLQTGEHVFRLLVAQDAELAALQMACAEATARAADHMNNVTYLIEQLAEVTARLEGLETGQSSLPA